MVVCAQNACPGNLRHTAIMHSALLQKLKLPYNSCCDFFLNLIIFKWCNCWHFGKNIFFLDLLK